MSENNEISSNQPTYTARVAWEVEETCRARGVFFYARSLFLFFAIGGRLRRKFYRRSIFE